VVGGALVGQRFVRLNPAALSGELGIPPYHRGLGHRC
jgi:hypothetical protein